MSLFRARAEEALAQAQERFLSSDACRDLLARAQRFCSGGGDIQLQIRSR